MYPLKMGMKHGIYMFAMLLFCIFKRGDKNRISRTFLTKPESFKI
jgi:hypothetical protein